MFSVTCFKSHWIHTIPKIWKTTEILPLPKKPKPFVLNDFRPVAPTSMAMKCLEWIVLSHLKNQTVTQMDTLQFAYTQKRGVENAITTLLNGMYKHLELPSSYVRILIADFSSAFNSIQSHTLIEKLMRVNLLFLKWIYFFKILRQATVSQPSLA